MKIDKKKIILGAISGLAGTAAKSIFNRLYTVKPKEMKTQSYMFQSVYKEKPITPVEAKTPLTRLTDSLLNIGLGTLGGIGSYFFSKARQDRLSEKITGGFVLGSTTDLILKALRRKHAKRKRFSFVFGNGLYGIVTGIVNNALDRYLADNSQNCLDDYIERMQVREENEKKKTKLRRFTQKDDLKKTS